MADDCVNSENASPIWISLYARFYGRLSQFFYLLIVLTLFLYLLLLAVIN